MTGLLRRQTGATGAVVRPTSAVGATRGVAEAEVVAVEEEAMEAAGGGECRLSSCGDGHEGAPLL